MGKKINNPKLHKQGAGQDSMISAFNQYANKLSAAKQKKIQKVGDTKQRLLEKKKSNKMMKVSKRTAKFALLEDGQAPTGLTHKGKKVNELDEFNDMNFDSDVDDEEFQKMHENLNFTGFDEDEEKKATDNTRPKSTTEVYKEIIEKSKLHKHLRQQIYEQNLQKANELDEEFPDFIKKLQFRTRDSNVKEKFKAKDHDFEKLANQLKDDFKVVSNKVIEKTQKYTDKMKQKKSEQLKSLMKDSSDQQGDIRGWVKNANKKAQIESDEEQEDELDDVQLSSGDEGDDDQESGEEEEDGDQDSEGEEEYDQIQQGQESQGQGQELPQEEQQEESQEIIIPAKKKGINKPNKHVQKQKPIPSKHVPLQRQKGRK